MAASAFSWLVFRSSSFRSYTISFTRDKSTPRKEKSIVSCSVLKQRPDAICSERRRVSVGSLDGADSLTDDLGDGGFPPTAQLQIYYIATSSMVADQNVPCVSLCPMYT
ncbi:hypothetical protein HRR83_008356 [Exophiala dermatitidis]|nr:hypothetical protein HRR73_007853 [Exophiala dermatitidis]KAJ4507629.1 hypothetical protein HRR74_007955 [Exophiala dermatitidis]KAJ4533069.1 hypothetical protein HRR76_008040 [Exophiala dermatitidis]KAJ4535195.1 hypothetical protein HRR77_008108 [Exophiala dermatitidis]KAJ4560649.1 hypothetical protein HRR79_007772 [Exophiala dermatitidis]